MIESHFGVLGSQLRFIENLARMVGDGTQRNGTALPPRQNRFLGFNPALAHHEFVVPSCHGPVRSEHAPNMRLIRSKSAFEQHDSAEFLGALHLGERVQRHRRRHRNAGSSPGVGPRLLVQRTLSRRPRRHAKKSRRRGSKQNKIRVHVSVGKISPLLYLQLQYGLRSPQSKGIETIQFLVVSRPLAERIEILMNPRNQSALVIVGHGSTLNPDSSDPTYQHADTIRERGVFAEVACAFWKEEPSLREVMHMVESREVYIVPNFISEGYFTREVIPRELGLDGAVTETSRHTLYYCDPVGIHPSMTGLLRKRARDVAPEALPAESTLIVVGHGTKLNERSAAAIKDQVVLLRECGEFGEVLDAYMEEPPLISDWHSFSRFPNVVVVPFFIADGLHSYQDIPVMLGLEQEPTEAASARDIFRTNPNKLVGKNLYYSSAIGTEASLADVIIDQTVAFRNARLHAE